MLDRYDGETAVSGEHEGTLLVRGYRLADLLTHASYDETAFLLLHGRLPQSEERIAFTNRVLAGARIDTETQIMLDAMTEATHPMDLLALGFMRDSLAASRSDNPVSDCEQMLGKMIAVFTHITGIQRDDSPANSIAAALVPPCKTPETRAIRESIIDRLLIAYADNEWNSSTYAARLIASTRADLTSAIIGGIAALKGSLHGGANEEAFRLLSEVSAPEQAAAFVRCELARKRRFMGFGHRRFRAGDPRAVMLRPHCAMAARETGNERLEAIAAAIERAIFDATRLQPNIDWPCARLLHYAGFEPRSFTPFFAVARTAGWCAHVLEEQARNRLISPQARYTGPAALEWPSVRD